MGEINLEYPVKRAIYRFMLRNIEWQVVAKFCRRNRKNFNKNCCLCVKIFLLQSVPKIQTDGNQATDCCEKLCSEKKYFCKHSPNDTMMQMLLQLMSPQTIATCFGNSKSNATCFRVLLQPLFPAIFPLITLA